MKQHTALFRRYEIEKQIRQFFWSHDFIETRTPLLVPSPGLEPHICPIEINNRHSNEPIFLPTSPEFAMKKLLARGALEKQGEFSKIFQLCPSFRDEPESPEHRPEFTMLEFYETEISLEALQARVEQLFLYLSEKIHGSPSFTFRKNKIGLSKPWPRFRVVDLFQEHLNIDLRKNTTAADLAIVCENAGLGKSHEDSWDDLYFKLWLNCIEPKLPRDQPVFVTHYPVSQSSLCNRVKDETGFEWANRFEVYVGQLELGNAFDELRDSVLQRKNFEHDQQIRRKTYGDAYPESPIDEAFIAAIAQMPPACGIALGVERICIFLLDLEHINSVFN